MIIFFVLLLLALSLAVLLQNRLLNAVVLLGVFSLISSVVYFLIGAPDVAVTEGAIGVAFVTFIYVLALSDQGKLHVISEEVHPFLYQEKGELRGIEFEILQGFADEIGLELEVEFVSHQELASLIGGRRADVLAGAYFPGYLPPEGLSNTLSYDRGRLTKVVRSGYEKGRVGILSEIEALGDLQVKDRDYEEEDPMKIGDMRTVTRQQDITRAELVLFDTFTDLIRAYNDGDIKAFIADSGRVSNALYRIDTTLREESEIVLIGGIEYCFAVSAEEDNLLDQLNNYITELRNSGKLEEFMDKHIR